MLVNSAWLWPLAARATAAVTVTSTACTADLLKGIPCLASEEELPRVGMRFRSSGHYMA